MTKQYDAWPLPTAEQREKSEASITASPCLNRLVRQPRHKWFSAPDRRCGDGWFGPHDTIEDAIIECASNSEGPFYPIFVAQGHKITKKERDDDCGAEFDWQVDSENAIEVRLLLERKRNETYEH